MTNQPSLEFEVLALHFAELAEELSKLPLAATLSGDEALKLLAVSVREQLGCEKGTLQ